MDQPSVANAHEGQQAATVSNSGGLVPRRDRTKAIRWATVVVIPLALLAGTAVLLSQRSSAVNTDGSSKVALRPPGLEIPEQEHPRKKEIDAAIARGVTHLKQRLTSKDKLYDGSLKRWAREEEVGVSALAGLALLEARLPADDPVVQKVLQIVRDAGPELQVVYTLSTALLFLNRLHDAAPLNQNDRQLVHRFALRLIAGQIPAGPWTYLNPPLTVPVEQELLASLENHTYQPRNVKPVLAISTLSQAQFALLGLWSSRRHGVAVRQPLLLASSYFIKRQDADGAWGYMGGTPEERLWSDSNTCAGLLALAMDKALREDPEFKNSAWTPTTPAGTDEQRIKAFAFLGRVLDKDDANKIDSYGSLYFLWSLERVGVIYGKSKFGGRDWYRWGADILLASQKENGSWKDKHGDMADTCFALLFLTRANLAPDLTDKLRDFLQVSADSGTAHSLPDPRKD